MENDYKYLDNELKNKEIVGRIIRQVRKGDNLTISELAEKVGISDNYLGKIERGEIFPSLAIIIKIANVLKISVDFLLDENLEINCDDDVFFNDTIIKKILKLTLKEKKYIYSLLKSMD